MNLKEAQNKAEAAKALLDEIEDAVGNGELKLDRSIAEVLDVAVDETSELALRLWTRGEMRREAERN
jgi:hypothetical protein